jgi:hypothetical protein
LLTPELLFESLTDFASCLKQGALIVIQNRNFDVVMAARQRWMEPQAAHEDQVEWLFQRFYDFEADGSLTFNIVTLRRENGGDWKQSIQSTQLRPLLAAELQDAFQSTGFESVTLFGGLTGSAFDPSASGNLVITALRARI